MATVLIVDDDPDFVEVVRVVLVKAGYQVLAASNGEQALKQAQQKRPDALILDVMMSYVTEGFNIARQFRAHPDLKTIPILMVSSLTGIQATESGPAQGQAAIDAWISKPVKPALLVEKINHLINKPSL